MKDAVSRIVFGSVRNENFHGYRPDFTTVTSHNAVSTALA